MADGDQFPHDNIDPVVRLERAAEEFAAVAPEVVRLLGVMATGEQEPASIPERVKAAASIILESLVAVTDATVQPALQNVPVKSSNGSTAVPTAKAYWPHYRAGRYQRPRHMCSDSSPARKVRLSLWKKILLFRPSLRPRRQ